jgi:hypothetical protein
MGNGSSFLPTNKKALYGTSEPVLDEVSQAFAKRLPQSHTGVSRRNSDIAMNTILFDPFVQQALMSFMQVRFSAFGLSMF